MPDDNLSQLVGALGAWLEAHPADASEADRRIVSGLILGGSLLGISSLDRDAPELAALSTREKRIVSHVRTWAFPNEASTPGGGAFAAAISHADDSAQGTPELDGPELGDAYFAAAADVIEHADVVVDDDPDVDGEFEVDDGEDAEVVEPEVATELEVDDEPDVENDPDVDAELETSPAADSRSRLVQMLGSERFWWAIAFVALAILVIRRLF